MATKRQLQVSGVIQREMSAVLRQEGTYIYGNVLVTVTNVVMSPDLGQAKVYLSIFNSENKILVLEEIRLAAPRLKQLINQRIKALLRRMPEIAYYDDETMDEVYRLNSVFDRLHRDNQMGSVDTESSDESAI